MMEAKFKINQIMNYFILLILILFSKGNQELNFGQLGKNINSKSTWKIIGNTKRKDIFSFEFGENIDSLGIGGAIWKPIEFQKDDNLEISFEISLGKESILKINEENKYQIFGISFSKYSFENILEKKIKNFLEIIKDYVFLRFDLMKQNIEKNENIFSFSVDKNIKGEKYYLNKLKNIYFK